MGTFANSEDPDEMTQPPHCLLRQNLSLEKKIQYYFGTHNL